MLPLEAVLPIIIFCISVISSSLFATDRVLRIKQRINALKHKKLSQTEIESIVKEMNEAIVEFNDLQWLEPAK